jgi:hypothetical protein
MKYFIYKIINYYFYYILKNNYKKIQIIMIDDTHIIKDYKKIKDDTYFIRYIYGDNY